MKFYHATSWYFYKVVKIKIFDFIFNGVKPHEYDVEKKVIKLESALNNLTLHFC